MSSNAEGIREDETLTTDNGQNQVDEDKLFAEAFAQITGKPSDEEPAPQQQEEETASEVEEAPEQPEQAASDTAWLDSLPDEAKKQFQQLMEERARIENNYRALHNRLAPTQRQLAEAQRRLNELTPQTRQPAHGDASKEEAPKQQGQEQDDLWSRIKDTDPVLAEAIEKQMERERQTVLQEVEARLRPVHERTREDNLRQETQALIEMVPNAVEVFSSPMFGDWLKYQPASMQAMFESPNHQDALALLRLYDSDMARWEAQNAPSSPPAPDANVAKVAARRQEKLNNPLPQQARPATPVAQAVKEEDADKLFNEFMKRELKQTSLPYANLLRS